MGDIQESSNSMLITVEGSTKKIGEFEDTLVKLSDNSGQIVDYSYNMENSILVVLVKLEHILYKTRAYNSIMSLSKLLEVSTTKECELGIWYHSDGKRRFENTSSFAKISAPHEEVHANANANMQYLDTDPENSTLANADKILSNFDKMEDASNELFILLDDTLIEGKS